MPMQNHVQHTSRKGSHPVTFDAQKTAKRAVRKIKQGARSVERSARPLVRRGQETASGVIEWMRAHPKTAAGIVLGAGAAYGLFGTRIGRTALFGVGAAAYAIYKRMR